MEQSSSSCLAGNPFLSDSNSNEEADEAPDRKLPQLPALYPHSSSLGRKRDLDEMIASSSDAPLFSSDDILASTVEDYRDNDRRKRKSRRTWYAEEKVGLRQTSAPASKQKGRGPFVRSIDSGVWMGSDESVETDVESQESAAMETGADVMSKTSEEKTLFEKAMRTTEDPGNFEGPVFPYWGKQPEPGHISVLHARQIRAQAKVMACVEAGDEDIDLSAMDLQQIRAPTLRPLRFNTKQPARRGKGSGYQPLTPSLRLYLSNNVLDDVPSEIYHLTNTEVLSLRNNRIKEILPPIGRLSSLQELNIGSNQLRWLPWELLTLLEASLEKCMIHPNPLLRPIPSWWITDIQPRSCDKPWQATCTRPAFLDINGRDSRIGWPPAPSQAEEYWPKFTGNTDFIGPDAEERNKTPSLFELALRACYKSPQLSSMPFLLPSDVPDLTLTVKKTWKIKEAGGQVCSVCGSNYIVPRTEWIEWWYCSPRNELLQSQLSKGQGLVPFLRRGCSWQCWVDGKNPRGWSGPARRDEMDESPPATSVSSEESLPQFTAFGN